jgi:hypothetical protein
MERQEIYGLAVLDRVRLGAGLNILRRVYADDAPTAQRFEWFRRAQGNFDRSVESKGNAFTYAIPLSIRWPLGRNRRMARSRPGSSEPMSSPTSLGVLGKFEENKSAGNMKENFRVSGGPV